MNDMNFPVTSIAGVGEVRAKSLAALGIFTLGDLLYHFPRAYQNRGDVRLLDETNFSEGTNSSYILTVDGEPKISTVSSRKNMSLLKFRAFDESGSCNITFFNQNYLADTFHIGSEFRFYGKVTNEYNGYQMNTPSFERYVEGIPLPEFTPIYPLSSGLTQNYVKNLVNIAFKKLLTSLEDHIPQEICEKFELCSLAFALENIHMPPNYTLLDIAVQRLSFDELFTFALALCSSKKSRRTPTAFKMADTDLTEFQSILPYKLTNAQSRAIGDVAFDMSKNFLSENDGDGDKKFVLPMSRIIVGDVGCGKTVCAAAAAYIAAKNGFQTAFMAPTEILAMQHYNELAPMFEKLGMKCLLLTGSTNPKQKKIICDSILNGINTIESSTCIDILIGTHSLIEDTVQFAKLGLVITDEQHRFGVLQRAALAEKSANTHVLVMSATPIPRTLSLIMYGDLDISLIDEMPPGRMRVDTYVVNESFRRRLNEFIYKIVRDGNQVYVVCPSVDEIEEFENNQPNKNGDDGLTFAQLNQIKFRGSLETQNQPSLKSAVNFAEELAVKFPKFTVSFVHGKLSSAKKEKVMREFCSGEINVLVSTTVIEVGVNVPNATLMIVENAERFGLSQLHQLRGRVGRGQDKSYCVLVSDSESKIAKERLHVMCTTYDGYTIAEKDLAIRGPGDLFATGNSVKQHGTLKFKLASSNTNTELLKNAFDAAKNLLESDPNLENYPILKSKVSKEMDVAITRLS